jgi:hypothetical protein
MLAIALVVLCLFALLPATAAADGLPAEGVDATPVFVPDGRVQYTTKPAPGGATRMIEHSRYGGQMRERRLDGRYSVPAVALDGSPSGLSADGRRLVLISPRRSFPRKVTPIAVVETDRLAITRRIVLHGDFSVDAISPDGRTLYLIQYRGRDPADYAVRAYDLRAARLLPDPIVDPREPDEPMNGIPVTRIQSEHGRWAYTLYQSAEHPFVHALDTERRTAACIELPGLGTVWNAILVLLYDRLDVSRGSEVLATIDVATHRVVTQSSGRPRHAAAGDDGGGDGAGTSWLPLAAPAVALLLLAALRRRRVLKKRPDEPITEAWEPNSDRHAPTG